MPHHHRRHYSDSMATLATHGDDATIHQLGVGRLGAKASTPNFDENMADDSEEDDDEEEGEESESEHVSDRLDTSKSDKMSNTSC